MDSWIVCLTAAQASDVASRASREKAPREVVRRFKSAQERLEAGLPEVLIRGEGFSNTVLAHHAKAETIGQGEALVEVLSHECLCLGDQQVIGINDEKRPALLSEIKEHGHKMRFPPCEQQSAAFTNDPLGGYCAATAISSRGRPSPRLFMSSIIGVEEGKETAGVPEHLSGHR